MPECNEEQLNKLVGCMERIYSNGYYPTIKERIANALYNITKGHFLFNGNKRVTAITIEHIIDHEKSFNSDIQEIKIDEKKLKKIISDVTCDRISIEELTEKISQEIIRL